MQMLKMQSERRQEKEEVEAEVVRMVMILVRRIWAFVHSGRRIPKKINIKHHLGMVVQHGVADPGLSGRATNTMRMMARMMMR